MGHQGQLRLPVEPVTFLEREKRKASGCWWDEAAGRTADESSVRAARKSSGFLTNKCSLGTKHIFECRANIVANCQWTMTAGLSHGEAPCPQWGVSQLLIQQPDQLCPSVKWFWRSARNGGQAGQNHDGLLWGWNYRSSITWRTIVWSVAATLHRRWSEQSGGWGLVSTHSCPINSQLSSISEKNSNSTQFIELFWVFRADTTSTTHWSGGRVQVWVQVQAPADHLAITPKGYSRR